MAKTGRRDATKQRKAESFRQRFVRRVFVSLSVCSRICVDTSVDVLQVVRTSRFRKVASFKQSSGNRITNFGLLTPWACAARGFRVDKTLPEKNYVHTWRGTSYNCAVSAAAERVKIQEMR